MCLPCFLIHSFISEQIFSSSFNFQPQTTVQYQEARSCRERLLLELTTNDWLIDCIHHLSFIISSIIETKTANNSRVTLYTELIINIQFSAHKNKITNSKWCICTQDCHFSYSSRPSWLRSSKSNPFHHNLPSSSIKDTLHRHHHHHHLVINNELIISSSKQQAMAERRTTSWTNSAPPTAKSSTPTKRSR